MPVEPHVPRHIAYRHDPAHRSDLHRKALRVARIVSQKI
jgi:hypothetical protein